MDNVVRKGNELLAVNGLDAFHINNSQEKQEKCHHAHMNGDSPPHSNLSSPLFSPDLLHGLDWGNATWMKGGVTCETPGKGLIVRPLNKEDYDKGFLQLLTHLTKVGDISRKEFEDRFDLMQSCPDHYYVTVVEDVGEETSEVLDEKVGRSGRVIAAATLAVEMKFIRGCAKRGRVEDVVVSEDYRGRQLGKLIVSTVTLLARAVGCYKVGLDCKDTMRSFYSTFGFKGEEGNDRTMVIRF